MKAIYCEHQSYQLQDYDFEKKEDFTAHVCRRCHVTWKDGDPIPQTVLFRLEDTPPT